MMKPPGLPGKFKTPRRGFDRSVNGLDQQLGNVIKAAVANEVAAAIAFNRPSAKYMTGARTIIRINDRVIAFAFSVAWNVQNETTEIFTIDEIAPHEIAPKRISVSGSLGLFQIPGSSPVTSGVMTDLSSFLLNKYITIEVKDAQTSSIIFKTDKAMITGMQGQVKAEAVSTSTLTWKAVGWQAEFQRKALEPIKPADAPVTDRATWQTSNRTSTSANWWET
jgi:hypothetical protein